MSVSFYSEDNYHHTFDDEPFKIKRNEKTNYTLPLV
jgi:hypothetical protein